MLQSDRKQFHVTAVLATVAVLCLAGCLSAAQPTKPVTSPPKGLAAYGAAMMHVFEAQNLERRNPQEAEKKWETAANLFQKAADENPKHNDTLQLLTVCNLRAGKLEDAAKTCEKLIDEDLIDTSVLALVITALVNQNNFTTAIELSEKYINTSETLDTLAPARILAQLSQLYQMPDQSKRGISFLSKLINKHPGSKETCEMLLLLYEQTGQTSEAEKQAKKFLKDNPKALAIRVLFADIFLKSGQHAKFISEIKAVADTPELPIKTRLALTQAALRFAVSVKDTEHITQAADILDKINTDHTDGFSKKLQTELQLQTIRIHTNLKNYDKAEVLLRKVDAPENISWRLQAVLAEIVWESGRRDEAIQILVDTTKGMIAGENLPQLRMTLAEFYEQSGQHKEAEAELRKNLSEKPDSPDSNNHLGYIFTVRGEKLDEAVEMIKKALETKPESGAYLDSLAWAYYKIALRDDDPNKLGESAEVIESSLKTELKDPVINRHAGDIYFVQGQLQKALDHWNKAIELSKDNSESLPNRDIISELAKTAEELIREVGMPNRPIIRPLKPPSGAPD